MNAVALAMPRNLLKGAVVGLAKLAKTVFHYYLCGVVAGIGTGTAILAFHGGWSTWKLVLSVILIPLTFIAATWINESR